MDNENNSRIAVIGIIISAREDSSKKVNEILSDYAQIIVGRMGIPYKEKEMSVISLIIDGSNEEIGALAGKLGNILNVKVKVSYLN